MFFVPGDDAYLANVVRFTIGVAIAFFLSQMLAWTASFIMPLLLSMLLTGPKIDIKKGLAFVLVILAGGMVGIILTITVVHFPFVCLLVVGLLLFHIYYSANKGLSPLLVLMLTMGVTVIPLLGTNSNSIAIALVQVLVFSGVVAVLLAIFMYWLIPEVEPREVEPPPQVGSGSPMYSALVSTIVMIPLVVAFYTFSLTGAIVVLIFSAILAQTPDLSAGLKTGIGLILANALGGLFAVAIYKLVEGIPDIVFLMLLISLVSLVFASKIFSKDPMAKLYSTAFTAILLLLGNALGINSGDAFNLTIQRVVQISMAATYIVLFFYLLKSWFAKETEPDLSMKA